MPSYHEITFEREIAEYLAARGWLYSPDDDGYDRQRALFPKDVFGWLADTQPDELAYVAAAASETSTLRLPTVAVRATLVAPAAWQICRWL